MAGMWLLAESWGRVTPAGTRVLISLSHEVLGGLVGARRSTVTLAVSRLAERGSLIRQDDEWLRQAVAAEPESKQAGTLAYPPRLLPVPVSVRGAPPARVRRR